MSAISFYFGTNIQGMERAYSAIFVFLTRVKLKNCSRLQQKLPSVHRASLSQLLKYSSIIVCMLTGVSVSAVMCSDSACRSISGESSTILCTDIWINSSKESNCCRTRPFSSKYELMTIQQASCHRSRVISSPSSSPYPPSRSMNG